LYAGFESTVLPARARNIIQVAGDGESGFSVYHDCRKLAVESDAGSALTALVAGVNNAVISVCQDFAVHSGVVGWDGGILALPAESGDGKSTLTAALVKTGFDYLSDEALVIDDSGAVVGYPKPLALSDWSARSLGLDPDGAERLVTPHQLGGSFFAGEGQLTDLVLAEYGHDDTSLDPLPRSQAVAALIKLSFNHYLDPERAFRLSTSVARNLSVWKLGYDHPLEAAELLSSTLR
ncbi:MAG: hypothetical protein ACRDU9_00105, partial [Acidimicrobiia bacterium]